MDEPSESITYLTPSGDLNILVNNAKKHENNNSTSKAYTRTFTVSSTVLCLASPVWKAMFDPKGHFKEATQPSSIGNKEVSFPDDEPDALLVLLNVIHLNFDKLPKTMDFHGLLNIAVLCDKYDMARVVRPWLVKWAEPSKTQALNQGHEEWAFIAWTFGELDTFNAVARKMVMESFIDGSGGLLDRFGKPYGKIMPPDLLGRLAQSPHDAGYCYLMHANLTKETVICAREERLAGLLKVCYKLADRYMTLGPPFIESTLCVVGGDSELCDTLVLGSFIKGLRSLDIFPRALDPSSMTAYSVSDYTKILLDLECRTFPDGYGSHLACKFTVRLQRYISAQNLAKEPSGVLDSHRKHMQEQAMR